MSIDTIPTAPRTADGPTFAPPASGRAARPVTPVLIGVVATGAAAVLLGRLLTGADYRPSPFGLPDAGAFTATALPLVGMAQEMAGIAAVGALVVRLLLGAHHRAGAGAGAVDDRLGSATVRWAWAWVACSAAMWVLSLSDLVGAPVAELPSRGDVVVLLFSTDRMLAVTATVWVAVLLVMFGRRFSGRAATAVLLGVAVAGLMPQALTGHVAHHNSDIVLATVALAVHVAAAAIWVGGLLTMVVHLRREPAALAVVTARFSALALGCVAAVGISGIVASVAMFDGWSELWSTERGVLILAKAAGLAALIAIGAWHRRRTVPAAVGGRIGPLLKLGAVELALMAGTVGLAVVLAGTA